APVWPIVQLAAGQLDPFGEPDQPGARSREREAAGNADGGAAGDFDEQGALAGGGPHFDRGTGRVFASIGEALLDDPVRRAAERKGDLLPGTDTVIQMDVHSGGVRLVDQAADLPEGGLRRLPPIFIPGVAQHADDVAELLQSGVGAWPDHPRPPADPFRAG